MFLAWSWIPIHWQLQYITQGTILYKVRVKLYSNLPLPRITCQEHGASAVGPDFKLAKVREGRGHMGRRQPWPPTPLPSLDQEPRWTSGYWVMTSQVLMDVDCRLIITVIFLLLSVQLLKFFLSTYIIWLVQWQYTIIPSIFTIISTFFLSQE